MRQPYTFATILRFWNTRRSAEEVRGGFNLPLYLRYLQVINNKSNEEI
jgi:hypothetical protein